MTISDLVNNYAKDYSPYMSGLVNHLPMGQIALYFMTGNLERVEDYSKYYDESFNIDPIKNVGTIVSSIDECLGKRDLYEPLLDFLNQKINEENVEEYISYILNTYPLGMSSGLFHTLIRLAYAVEAYREDSELLDEVRRALSYYVTGYRQASLFTREIEANHINKEMKNLLNNEELKDILDSQNSMGRTMKALYNSKEYMELGFIIKGDENDKINALLDLTLPAFTNSQGKGDILILHCITGLHALIVLKEYFNDFDKSLDILTTCIVTHLMTVDYLDLREIGKSDIDSFDKLINMGVESPDVHTIKFTYTTSQIYNKFNREDLKTAAHKRILNT